MFYNLHLWKFIYVIRIVHSSFMPNFKMFRAGLQMRSTTFKGALYTEHLKITRIQFPCNHIPTIHPYQSSHLGIWK